jgi:hypothetical protein
LDHHDDVNGYSKIQLIKMFDFVINTVYSNGTNLESLKREAIYIYNL